MILPALLIAVTACAAPPKSVSFRTKDGWTISASYRPARGKAATVILAHGVGSSKDEWTTFAERLAAVGVGSLSFDLRGHGDSRNGPHGPRDAADFDATGEWPRAVGDLAAAADWLTARGVPEARIALGGASIGANLAAVAAEARPKTPFLLLLSAGPDYRGVTLRKPRTRTLAVASPGDQYAYGLLSPLAAVNGVETLRAPTGHGVQMFADPATLKKISDWVVAASKAP